MTDTLVALFTERLQAVGGHVHVVTGAETAARAIQAIDSGRSSGMAWVSPELATRAPDVVSWLAYLGIAAPVPTDPAAVRDQPLGIALAEGAIAETGSAILSEPRVEGRSITLMTNTLVILCARDMLLPSIDEASAVLRRIAADGASYATFLTGPSRTADIELSLTIGVQGPARVVVLFVDDLT